ncbi:MAG: spore germination protein [Acetatifactor sp.]
MGYALKFFRILNLILTQLFGLIGYLAAIVFALVSLGCNHTISRNSYLYPLIPFDWNRLKNRIIRRRLPGSLHFDRDSGKE